VILIVSDNQSLVLNSAKKIRDLRKRNIGEEVNSVDYLLNQELNDKDYLEETKTPITAQGRKLIRAGYESEQEKSIDSATTSSTMIL